VKHDIGIGVAKQAQFVFDPHTSQDQRAAFYKSVRIMP
jgi:hypothetical protein